MTDDSSPNGDIRMMQVTHDHLLEEAVKITQPADGYRVGSDTVLLAASVPPPAAGCWTLAPGSAGYRYAWRTVFPSCR